MDEFSWTESLTAPEVGRLAAMRGIDLYEAALILDARDAKIEAQWEADQAAEKARKAEIASQENTPITEDFAKKIARKLQRGMNQAQRSNFRYAIGEDDALWQRLANPQTREAAIASLSLAQARRILNK